MDAQAATPSTEGSALRLGTAFLGFLASTFAMSAVMVLLAQA